MALFLWHFMKYNNKNTYNDFLLWYLDNLSGRKALLEFDLLTFVLLCRKVLCKKQYITWHYQLLTSWKTQHSSTDAYHVPGSTITAKRRLWDRGL